METSQGSLKRPADPEEPRIPDYHAACSFDEAHDRAVSAVTFGPDPPAPHEFKRLASTSADMSIKLWQLSRSPETGSWDRLECVRTIPGHSQEHPAGHAAGCNDITWSADASTLCSASDDKTLKLWAPDSGLCLATLEGHTNYVMCCHFHPRGHMLASGSFDETLRVWDVQTSRCIRSIPAHADPVTAVAFNTDGTMIVSCSYDGLVRVWNTGTGQCLRSLVRSSHPPISHVCWAPNSKYILASSLDETVRLWDFQGLQDRSKTKVVKQCGGHVNTKFCLFACFAQGALMVSGSEDARLYVWHTRKKGREAVQVLGGEGGEEGHSDIVLCCSAHEELIASGGSDCRILIWEDRNPQSMGNSSSKRGRTS